MVINDVLKYHLNHDDWYVDKLVNNFDLTCKPLYRICKFIYMARSPQVPLATMISRGYTATSAENYYLFRLRRMCEMAIHTGGILLTYEDLITKRVFPLLKNFLDLKSPLTEEFVPFQTDDKNLQIGKIIKDPVEPGVEIPEEILKRSSTGYKRYLKFLESRTNLIRFAI